MGLFGSSDPTKQTEKVIAQGESRRHHNPPSELSQTSVHRWAEADVSARRAEAKTEEKQLKQAIKDVSNAEKQEAHAQKAEHHAHAVSPGHQYRPVTTDYINVRSSG